MNINEEIHAWQLLKKQVEELQSQEREARIKIASRMLGDKIEGGLTQTLGDYKLSATAVLNYTIDKDMLSSFQSQLTEQDWTAIEYVPRVKASAFRKLPENSLVHRMVKTTPGISQLKVVEYFGEDNDY